MNLPGKEYIGDSVYVRFNANSQIELTTENGYEASNTIYLEPEVYESLANYVQRVKYALQNSSQESETNR